MEPGCRDCNLREPGRRQSVLSQATVTLPNNSEQWSCLKQGFVNYGRSLQVMEGFFHSRSTGLDTRLETHGNFPAEELGKPQPLLIGKSYSCPSWEMCVYLTGTCGVRVSCRPGRQGWGWSRAAGTCSCRSAGSACVPPRASSRSAGPCWETGSARRPWSGDRPEGKKNVRKAGVGGWGRGEAPGNARELQPGWRDGHAQGARMDLPRNHPPRWGWQ